MTLKNIINSYLDHIGATASLVCALHCALLPFVVSLLPLLGLSFLAHEQTELWLIFFALGVGALRLLPSYWRQHRQRKPLGFFALGSALLISTLFGTESLLEIPLAVAGASLVACAHLVNKKLCMQCASCRSAENSLTTSETN